MANDAKIRIRLDGVGEATREMSDLAKQFEAVAEASGGASVGGPGGGGGGGGMSLGRLAALGSLGIGAFGLTRGVLGGIRQIGQAATEGPKALLEQQLLGDFGARARGSMQALGTIRGEAGLAVGLSKDKGAAAEGFRRVFDALRQVETAAERGELELTKKLGLQYLGGEAQEVLKVLRQIRDAISGGGG